MVVVMLPPPTLGPDRALLRWGLLGTVDVIGLPLVDSLPLEVLVSVEILTGL